MTETISKTEPATGSAIKQLPDLAVQFVPCLEDLPKAPPDLPNKLQRAIKSVFRNADPRYTCLPGTGTLSSTGILGIWMTPATTAVEGLIRDQNLRLVNVRQPGGNCWLYINANFMNNKVTEAYNARPHRYSSSGQADDNGPIHIYKPRLSFQSPGKVVTEIDGLDEETWPDTNFKILLTDTLAASKGRILIASAQSLDPDTEILDILAALVSTVIFLGEHILILTCAADPPPGLSGAGAQAAQLIPAQIMIEGGQKIAFFYDAIQADATGLTTRGVHDIIARSPFVRIAGPTKLKVRGQKFAEGSFSTSTFDLRPALTVHWTVHGGIAATPNAEKSVIRFGVPSSAAPESSFTRTVQVAVTDADGLTASASSSVHIEVADSEDSSERG